jgi:hypothetical protein
MAKSPSKPVAQTVTQYLDSLPADRRVALEKVRKIILKNLPQGYQEEMTPGAIVYSVPLARLPKTYNGHPLWYAALASQKNYMVVYLMSVYGDTKTLAWFTSRYKASGKKLDMGKSCVRFKTLDDLPLDLIGEVIARTSVDDWIKVYQQSRKT